jgi:hypothetical protein
VTTLTKVVREVHHVGPDGQPVDYVGVPYSGVAVLPTSTAPSNYPHSQFTNYEILASQEPYPPLDPGKSKLTYCYYSRGKKKLNDMFQLEVYFKFDIFVITERRD